MDLRENDKPVKNESGHYSTHLFTEKAIDVIRNHDQSQVRLKTTTKFTVSVNKNSEWIKNRSKAGVKVNS